MRLTSILNLFHIAGAIVTDSYFDQYISRQSSLISDAKSPHPFLPFQNAPTDALYDKNGKCFVLLTSDNVLWSSRQTRGRDKMKMEPIYGEWKKVHEFSDSKGELKMIKAPDSIILVSTSQIYEVVMDFSCSFLTTMDSKLDPSTPNWGVTHSLAIAFNSLWIGSDDGLLQIVLPPSDATDLWTISRVDSVPSNPPVTAMEAVESWGILFVGTNTVFYELRFVSPDFTEYTVHHDWIGGNIDSAVVDMSYDPVADCLWVVETNSLHCRDSSAMWWRYGYYQGAITDNMTTVSVMLTDTTSYVWTGTRDRGLVRLRADAASMAGETAPGDDWTLWLMFYGPRFLPDANVRLLVSDSDTLDDTDARTSRKSSMKYESEKYESVEGVGQEKEEDKTGTVLVVTDKGVTFLSVELWTLAEKQTAMQSFQYPRHDRNGIVAEVSLESYGDLSKYYHSPEDSDSIWTSQYAVAASFRYASSGLESDRLQAWRSFEALELLGNVTGIDGLVGRTMCSPSERASASLDSVSPSLRGGEGGHLAHRTVGCGTDGEGNWHASSTMLGWVWKGDTSSDTVDGHYFAYGVVLDLVAKNEEERARVVHAIDRLTSYIVKNDLYYVDVTGEPTKWGRWNPKDLNDDPNYYSERGGNSLQILAFLALAYSVTGKEIYYETFTELTESFNYFENVLNQKIDNPYNDNHSDNELGFMAYHTLFYAYKRLQMNDCGISERERVTRAARLEAMTAPVLPSIKRFWRIVRDEKSPLWIGGVAGAASVAVKEQNLIDAVTSLQLWAIDLIGWGVHNTGRWDCEQQPYYGRDNPDELQMRSIRPPQERATGHWNVNPLQFDTNHDSTSAYDSGGGMVEYSPAEWLLPYWMMRFYGLITPSPTTS